MKPSGMDELAAGEAKPSVKSGIESSWASQDE